MPHNQMLDEILSGESFQLDSGFVDNKDIILYGAGRLGDMAVNIFAKNDVKISCFIDENYRERKDLNGYPIYSIDRLKEVDPEKTVILVSAFKVPFYELKKLISTYTAANIFTVYDLMYFIDGAYFSNGWYTGKLSNTDCHNIRGVFNSLSDDLSKKTYLNFLNWRINRDEYETIGSEIICEEEKYHNSITLPAFLKPGILIDAGAFDLSFSLKSMKKGYSISRCIAFEPDLESNTYCLSLLKGDNPENLNICLESYAIGQKTAEVGFISGHGLASRLVFDNGDLPKVKVITLCDYFREYCHKEKLSVLKIHIEGAELESLLGGKKVIEEHRPLLMINCSHNRDGLWAIQKFCLNLIGYNYYMRSHAFYGEGLTFYAVPAR